MNSKQQPTKNPPLFTFRFRAVCSGDQIIGPGEWKRGIPVTLVSESLVKANQQLAALLGEAPTGSRWATRINEITPHTQETNKENAL